MSKIVLIADFAVKAESCEAFKSLMRDHAAKTLEEEGCLQFDVGVDLKDPNRVVLVELYRDRAALDTHAESDLLAKTRAAYSGMVTDRRVTICSLD